MVLDLLTLQTDRHAWNINFIIDETNYSVKVALLFDNEFAFSIENIFDLAQNSSNSTPISMPTLLREYYKTAKSLRVNDNYHEFSIGFRKRVADLVDLAKHNKKMGLFLAKAIKNININKAIEDVEKFGLEINQEYKEYITKVFRATKHMFFEELRKPINEEDFNVYDELIK